MPRGSRRGRGRARVNRATRTEMRHLVFGRVLKLSPDPPLRAVNPFSQLSLLGTYEKTVKFTVADIYKLLKDQLGLADAALSSTNLKLYRVRGWATSDKLMLTVCPEPGWKSIKQFIDTRGINHYSRVGWEWSREMWESAYDYSSTNIPVCEFSVSTTNATTEKNEIFVVFDVAFRVNAAKLSGFYTTAESADKSGASTSADPDEIISLGASLERLNV